MERTARGVLDLTDLAGADLLGVLDCGRYVVYSDVDVQPVLDRLGFGYTLEGKLRPAGGKM